MSRAVQRLPTWRHFAVTWGLPDDFGGMTSAIFRRAAGFAAAGAPVTIVTFDDRLNTAEAVSALRQRGALDSRVEVLQLWDWLADNPLDARPEGGELPFAPVVAAAQRAAGNRVDEVEHAGVVRRRVVRSPEGVILQVDRYRADGSLLASDLRDREGRRRSVFVCDRDGAPVRGWTSMWGLYRLWLDLLTDKRRSMIIVDSKTAARFVRGYRRRHVVTVHVVHSAHRSGSGEPGRGLKASRREVLENASDFDAVVALTDRQRADLAADLGPAVTLAVVPNAGPIERLMDAPLPRDAARGVMLASLTTRKRVWHAADAAQAARVPLDVYGEGPERASLEQHVRHLGGDRRVRLRGHHPDATLAFRDASFTLVTSTSEGSPLVLVEAMAAGCIPIAYDIRYGPADVIRHGVDGFVVPPGDTGEMAARIREVVDMPENRRRRMRRAAKRAATRYGTRSVTGQWASLFSEIADRRWPGSAKRTLRSRVLRRVRRRSRST